MTEILPAALLAAALAGLLGSTHCVGMCGGVALLSGQQAQSPQWRRTMAFNAGRIGSYTLTGALAGGLGSQLGALLHDTVLWGSVLRVAMGLLMVAIGLHLSIGWTGLRRLERLGVPVWRRLGPLAGRLDPRRSALHSLAFGALWGWIPCGLVYSALMAALVSGGATAGAAVMLAFGLGTAPALLSLGLLGETLRPLMAQRGWRRSTGFIVIGLGLWTIAGPLIGAGFHQGHHLRSGSALTALPETVRFAAHVGHDMQTRQVQQDHLSPIHLNQAFLLKPREQTADGFHGKPQIIGDLAARHAQVKPACRQASTHEAA